MERWPAKLSRRLTQTLLRDEEADGRSTGGSRSFRMIPTGVICCLLRIFSWRPRDRAWSESSDGVDAPHDDGARQAETFLNFFSLHTNPERQVPNRFRIGSAFGWLTRGSRRVRWANVWTVSVEAIQPDCIYDGQPARSALRGDSVWIWTAGTAVPCIWSRPSTGWRRVRRPSSAVAAHEARPEKNSSSHEAKHGLLRPERSRRCVTPDLERSSNNAKCYCQYPSMCLFQLLTSISS